ncbi:MAG: DUF4388 domain-containing protein [Anaerolineae bacterium]|nr:DUF4388 domain-containing protein [Anaerolineae bacterium]
MAIKGDLRNFSTTQLLNLINLARKTGTLTIFEGIPTGEQDALGDPRYAPGKERARVAFKVGKLIHAAMGMQDGNLASVLHKAGKLNSRQAQLIRERAVGTGDKALALLLIQANYVTQADIVNSVQQHTLDIVYDLLAWNEGPFEFEDSVLPPDDRITVPVDLENVIIEGSRRMRELERLTDELPNLDFALKFPEDPGDKFKGIHLSVEEWRVVSFVNPKNSIRQIAKANNMSDMEIRRIVYGLLQAGLVELVKPPGMTTRPAASRKAPQIKKTVVNKLIDRIRTL